MARAQTTSRSRKTYADTPTHTIVVDWDGTAVPNQWPDRPMEFMPGFVKAMRKFHKEGFAIVIASARISPWDPWSGQRRPKGHAEAEVQWMRAMLDREGLTFISIWTKEGKPGGSVYIDDKAERYGGRANSWDRMTSRVLLRLGKEDAVFPRFQGEE